MGGHGGSSGYTKVSKAAKEISDLKDDLYSGNINLGQYVKAKKDVVGKYGLSKDETKLAVDMTNMTSESDKKQAYKEAKSEKSSVNADVSSLPGQNGNPWPPDASNKHIAYSEGGGKAIWTQLGGGVKNGGVSAQTAKEMNTAIKSYTGTGYKSMRNAYVKGDTTSLAGKKAANVQAFIEKSIETGNGWNGGTTYRGIGGLSDSTWKKLVNLKPGDSVDCNLSAPASWSTKRSTSENFGGSYNHITFVHLGKSQKGVSVDHISTCEGENEVLVSGKVKYKVVGVSPTKYYYGNSSGPSQTYIYVEDAD